MKHVRSVEHEVLMPVMKYYDLFTGMLPCMSRGIHKMKTGALPIKKNRYKVSFALKEEMGRQLDDILQRGAITPACSKWAAPVILVKKKFTILQNINFIQIFVG